MAKKRIKLSKKKKEPRDPHLYDDGIVPDIFSQMDDSEFWEYQKRTDNIRRKHPFGNESDDFVADFWERGICD